MPMIINEKESEKFFKTIQDGSLGIIVFNGEGTSYKTCHDLFNITYVGDDIIIASIYDERHGEKFAVIDTATLKEVTKYEYDYIEKIGNDGMLKVCKGGQYGVLKADGKILIACEFDQITYNEDNNSLYVE